jgi:hypothetical protein
MKATICKEFWWSIRWDWNPEQSRNQSSNEEEERRVIKLPDNPDEYTNDWDEETEKSKRKTQ